MIKSVVRKGILDEKLGAGRLLGELLSELIELSMSALVKRDIDGDLDHLLDKELARTQELMSDIKHVMAKWSEILEAQQMKIDVSQSTLGDLEALRDLLNADFGNIPSISPECHISQCVSVDSILQTAIKNVSSFPEQPCISTAVLKLTELKGMIESRHATLYVENSKADQADVISIEQVTMSLVE